MWTCSMSENLIHLKNIIKKYYVGQENELEILHGINLDVTKGEFISIVGESGSGKSTMMNIIGLLDKPTEGEYLLEGEDMMAAKSKELSRIRNQKIGFVFQTYNLIARTTALSNVEVPLMYAGASGRERRDRAKELLKMVGMEDRMNHTPDELSGGQKQRVAIARAMANDPPIILADEPTGALDSKTGYLVMDIFHKLHDENGKTIVLITHSNELAAETERIVTLKDGSIINDTGIREGYRTFDRVQHEKAGDLDANKANALIENLRQDDMKSEDGVLKNKESKNSFSEDSVTANATKGEDDV